MFVGMASARYQPAYCHGGAHFGVVDREGATSLDQLADIEAEFYGMIRWPIHDRSGPGLGGCLSRVAVVEVFLVLRLLPGGSATSLADAFVLETTGV